LESDRGGGVSNGEINEGCAGAYTSLATGDATPVFAAPDSARTLMARGDPTHAGLANLFLMAAAVAPPPVAVLALTVVVVRPTSAAPAPPPPEKTKNKHKKSGNMGAVLLTTGENIFDLRMAEGAPKSPPVRSSV
jgi:hypothetical protein